MKDIHEVVCKEVLNGMIALLDRQYDRLQFVEDARRETEDDMRVHADVVVKCYEKGIPSEYESRYVSILSAISERQRDYDLTKYAFSKVLNEGIGIYDLYFDYEFQYDYNLKTHVLKEVNYDEEEA